MSIFMHFGGHWSQMKAKYAAMEMDATLPREPKSGVFNGLSHLEDFLPQRELGDEFEPPLA